jgi:hypothetical protein
MSVREHDNGINNERRVFSEKERRKERRKEKGGKNLNGIFKQEYR